MMMLHCRQAYKSSDGGNHPSITAAGKVNLSAEQVERGLQYRQHVLGTLDRCHTIALNTLHMQTVLRCCLMHALVLS